MNKVLFKDFSHYSKFKRLIKNRLKFAKIVKDLKNESKQPLFQEKYIKFFDDKKKLSCAQKYSNKNHKDYEITMECLGIESKLKDTKKPNLLIVSSELENTRHFMLSLELIEKFRKHHDFKLIMTNNENDLYKELTNRKYNSLIIFSHGDPNGIYLNHNDNKPSTKNKNHETNKIDLNDYELKKYLSYMSSDAAILLISCSTVDGIKYDGEGHEKNIANFISDQGGIGRDVIASSKPIGIANIKFNYKDLRKTKFYVRKKDVTEICKTYKYRGTYCSKPL